MSTFGLIIQGSLVSSGRKSGKTAHLGWRNIREEDWVQYDCRENIRNIIREFGHLFDAVVVSTWKQDVREDDRWEGATLVASDDSALPRRYRKDKQGRTIEDNRFRQMLSVLAGIEHIEKHSQVDMVVKVRTDQHVDVARMLEFIKRAQVLKTYTPEVIFVPSIMREDVRYGILDFYFAGSVSAMRTFHQSLFLYNAFEFDPSIHRELWLKYAYATYKNKAAQPEYAYFPAAHASSYCKETLGVFRYMVQHVFWPLSFDCFKTIVWRGTPFSREALESEQKNNIFQEVASEESSRQITKFLVARSSHVLGVDWLRYLNFRSRFSKSPSLSTEAIFFWGMAGLQLMVRFFARAAYLVAHPSAFFAGAKRRLFRLAQTAK